MKCLINVECIDQDICPNCPDLVLKISQEELYGDGPESWNVNHVYCANFRRCNNLLRFMEKRKNQPESQKEQGL